MGASLLALAKSVHYNYATAPKQTSARSTDAVSATHPGCNLATTGSADLLRWPYRIHATSSKPLRIWLKPRLKSQCQNVLPCAYTSDDMWELMQICFALHPEQGNGKARKQLAKCYGQRYRIASAFVIHVINGPIKRGSDGVALRSFSVLLTSYKNTSTDIIYLSKAPLTSKI